MLAVITGVTGVQKEGNRFVELEKRTGWMEVKSSYLTKEAKNDQYVLLASVVCWIMLPFTKWRNTGKLDIVGRWDGASVS